MFSPSSLLVTFITFVLLIQNAVGSIDGIAQSPLLPVHLGGFAFFEVSLAGFFLFQCPPLYFALCLSYKTETENLFFGFCLHSILWRLFLVYLSQERDQPRTWCCHRTECQRICSRIRFRFGWGRLSHWSSRRCLVILLFQISFPPANTGISLPLVLLQHSSDGGTSNFEILKTGYLGTKIAFNDRQMHNSRHVVGGGVELREGCMHT